MMNKRIILSALLLAVLISVSAFEYTIPKVLFVTTGDGDGRGTVSDGVILALQEFNKSGAFVRLENRKILHNQEELSEYSIMILPTVFGYHDADRRYSLSFLSDSEMINISNWVKSGGTLVSDINLGRNTISGEDRINKSGEFTPDNWIFADCFGTNLTEMNLENFHITNSVIDAWSDDISDKFDSNEWTPVATNITSNNAKVLASWKNDDTLYPAILQNKFYEGNTILLGNFSIIHPASDGGFSNATEIQAFYKYVYELAVGGRKYSIDLNPWKNGARTAFCLTFNDGGSAEEYDRIIKLLKKQKIKSSFFVTDNVTAELKKKIKDERLINLGSHSHTNADFRTISYPQTIAELLENRSDFDAEFRGFRFPFTNNSFLGMMALEELDYVFDTSIGVNHLEFFRGSVFPYNIPIFKDGHYLSLDLLEISQNFRDDRYYFQNKLKDKTYDAAGQKTDSAKFDSYLKRLWERAILPNHGLMVFVGHPMYSGISEITIQPLENMIKLAQNDGAWITDLDEIADFWNKRKDLNISIMEKENYVTINFNLKSDSIIKNLSMKLPQKPKEVKFSRKYHFVENNEGLFIVFDSVKTNDEAEIEF
jgi:peptidoglycan/xylan/chitin deacetylase (PgdA/CDA1 family)